MAHSLIWLAFFLFVSVVNGSPIADADTEMCQRESEASGNIFTAIGLGVSDLDASTNFYVDVFGYRNLTRMDLSGWKEDILLGEGSSSIVTMQWKDDPPRNVKDLPIKLQFTVSDPKATQDQILSSGGEALPEYKTASQPTAIYAKDPDGYLLELLTAAAATGTGLTSIGLGTSNLEEATTFWSDATGNTASEIQDSPGWKSSVIQPDRAVALELLDWKETPKRPTENLPIKVVIGATSPTDFVSHVADIGGEVVMQPIPLAGNIVGFCRDVVDRTLIEINQMPD